MPEANAATFSLDDKSPAELEQRRRFLITEMTTRYKGYDDPDMPTSVLQELAVVTSMLRRKNAGPPKAAKKPKAVTTKGTKPTIDDLLD